MDIIPCAVWVRRGIAKSVPDKLALTREELKELIHTTKEGYDESLQQDEEYEDDDHLEQHQEIKVVSKIDENIEDEQEDDDNTDARYKLDTYDEDDSSLREAFLLAGLTLHEHSKDDPYITVPDEDDDGEKEDNEDFVIKKNDNLLVVGRVEGDMSALEVYVYNEEDSDQYIHHDIVLPAYPLAVEWLGIDTGNFVAVGDMTPVISIWDLDVVDAIETNLKLGGNSVLSKSKKAVSACNGHHDAVLDLSWNTHKNNLLVSGSADNTVCLWDLEELKFLSKYFWHQNKVQSLKWHPFEAQILLSSCCDGVLRLTDCRSPEQEFKLWNVEGEIEKVLWNHFDPYYLYCSTDQGFVYCMDSRNDGTVYSIKAHNQAVTGLALSSQCPGCLITTSTDRTFKVWDVNSKPQFIVGKKLKLGSIFTAKANPDSPFIVALGGDNKSNNLKILDMMEISECCDHFGQRSLPQPLEVKNDETSASSVNNGSVKEECVMETCHDDFIGLNLSDSVGNANCEKPRSAPAKKSKMRKKYKNKKI